MNDEIVQLYAEIKMWIEFMENHFASIKAVIKKFEGIHAKSIGRKRLKKLK